MTKIQKKRKKLTKKEQQQQKEIRKKFFFCVSLSFIILLISYLIFYTDILKPELNEMTASYISFNNSNTTDMLKINNLEKLSDKKGVSSINDKNVIFEVTGKEAETYSVVVYPTNSNSDFRNIKFALEKNGKLLISDTLNNQAVSQDGGIVILKDKIAANNKLTLRMWLTKKYHKDKHNLAFEIKVKS